MCITISRSQVRNMLVYKLFEFPLEIPLFEFPLCVMIVTDSVVIKTALGPGMACATVRELRIYFLHHTHC